MIRAIRPLGRLRLRIVANYHHLVTEPATLPTLVYTARPSSNQCGQEDVQYVEAEVFPFHDLVEAVEIIIAIVGRTAMERQFRFRRWQRFCMSKEATAGLVRVPWPSQGLPQHEIVSAGEPRARNTYPVHRVAPSDLEEVQRLRGHE